MTISVTDNSGVHIGRHCPTLIVKRFSCSSPHNKKNSLFMRGGLGGGSNRILLEPCSKRSTPKPLQCRPLKANTRGDISRTPGPCSGRYTMDWLSQSRRQGQAGGLARPAQQFQGPIRHARPRRQVPTARVRFLHRLQT